MRKLVLFSSIYNDEEIGKKIAKMSKNGYNSKICFIPSFTMKCALENSHIFSSFVEMGFKKENIKMFDICFKYDKANTAILKNADIVILGGGNTFLFQWLLVKRDIMSILFNLSANGAILVGESAGSIMMSNTINIAQFADDDFVLSENHNGINVSPIEIKPHFQSWYGKIELFSNYSLYNGDTPIYCLEDGMCVIVDGENIMTYGDTPFIIKNGNLYYENSVIGRDEYVY